MDKKVILDDKSFKALSAESRVNILKKLLSRRMTLSELSKRLSLRDSTVKEHCNILLDAELVKKIDEGRKWKYYELTHKGKQVVSPNMMEEARVLVMLSFGAIVFVGIILFALQGLFIQGSFSTTNDQFVIKGSNVLERTNNIGDLPLDNTASGLDKNEPNNTFQTNDGIIIDQTITISGIDYNLFSISVVIALVIGIFAGWVVGRKT